MLMLIQLQNDVNMFYAGGVEKIKYALAFMVVCTEGGLQTMYCSLLQGRLNPRIYGKCSLIAGGSHSSLVTSVC